MSSSTPIGGPAIRDRATALLRGRCPRCRQGQVFAGRVTMHERCSECGLKYEREQGYFVGSMYISYLIAVVLITLLFWLVSVFMPDTTFNIALTLAVVLFLPFVPAVFRYSRIIWMHVDRTVDP